MTDAQLIGLARQVLNMANTDRRNTGYGGIVLASYHEADGEVHRMRDIERLIPMMLGEKWLDNGRAKELGFGAIRHATELAPEPPDAVIIVTAANMFLPTEKLKALPFEEQKKLVNTGHADHHRMAAEGLLRIVDCFSAVAQTSERVCNVVQEVDHGELVDKPVVTNLFDQKDFEGNLKMFGEKEEELDFTKKNPARVN